MYYVLKSRRFSHIKPTKQISSGGFSSPDNKPPIDSPRSTGGSQSRKRTFGGLACMYVLPSFVRNFATFLFLFHALPACTNYDSTIRFTRINKILIFNEHQVMVRSIVGGVLIIFIKGLLRINRYNNQLY